MSETVDRRQADRDPMEQRAEIRWTAEDTERSATALLQNFSLRGLFLHLKEELVKDLPPGTAVVCKFRAPADLPSIGGVPIECRGKVTRSEEVQGAAGTAGLAVEVETILFL